MHGVVSLFEIKYGRGYKLCSSEVEVQLLCALEDICFCAYVVDVFYFVAPVMSLGAMFLRASRCN